ncbi:MAG: hypothetical protein P8R42_07735 [Candidatus Binatia bacterium]|nr:hypothetical protein [Candidatus Binatia bacterium]
MWVYRVRSVEALIFASRLRRCASRRRFVSAVFLLVASVSVLSGSPASAWVYPEHRDIALLSVETLDPERREVFDTFWEEARSGTTRLCAQGADREQSTTPTCIDWAAFSAIAGDHSCSAADALETVLESEWILEVADVSAQLKKDLAQVEVSVPVDQQDVSTGPLSDFQRRMASEAVRAERTNALRTADTRLQNADPEYATRAGANNAHFLLARPSVDTEAVPYSKITLAADSEINAMGVYAWYHMRALEKARRIAQGGLTLEQRKAYARAMLIDEAFGLHFLEDMFAAGHVAGTWGDASQRKGTHDYYNEVGLEAFTWGRQKSGVVLMGDARMRPQDAELAAEAIVKSLNQVLDTAAGNEHAVDFELTREIPMSVEAFDVCKSDTMPAAPPGQARGSDVSESVYEILLPTAVPGLGAGLGALPRFRAEIGPFVGLAAAIDARAVSGGFVPGEQSGAIGGLDIAARAGLGLDGVIGESGDGLVFAQVGLRADTASSSSLSDSEATKDFGSISATIPSRIGLATRFRMPFFLIPGDLLLMSPLLFVAPDVYTKMAVTAGNGGFIPWQQGMATRVGRFQFVLGRELGVNFYGILGDSDRLAAPGGLIDSGVDTLLDYDSTLFDLPIAEYRPYRSFSSDQSSQLLFQLFVGADVPSNVSVVLPQGGETVDLQTVWSFGLRFTFDWRYYM